IVPPAISRDPVVAFAWTARPVAATIGLLGGNRNMAVVGANLGSAARPELMLFFALMQIPIYALPIALPPGYRRVAGRGLTRARSPGCARCGGLAGGRRRAGNPGRPVPAELPLFGRLLLRRAQDRRHRRQLQPALRAAGDQEADRRQPDPDHGHPRSEGALPH